MPDLTAHHFHNYLADHPFDSLMESMKVDSPDDQSTPNLENIWDNMPLIPGSRKDYAVRRLVVEHFIRREGGRCTLVRTGAEYEEGFSPTVGWMRYRDVPRTFDPDGDIAVLFVPYELPGGELRIFPDPCNECRYIRVVGSNGEQRLMQVEPLSGEFSPKPAITEDTAWHVE